MSPGSRTSPPLPAATAIAHRLSAAIGAAVFEARSSRGWTARETASRARVSVATVTNVEAGRVASLDTYARLASALGFSLELGLNDKRRRRDQPSTDVVHAAMGEWEATRLSQHSYRVAIDHPYQHYQFAGRADVLAWTSDPPALLHIENRTRFPDLQSAAGSYNAKREYLGRVVASQLDLPRFGSETHVMVGLWSAEVLHAIRLRPATFRALCADDLDGVSGWIAGTPPTAGRTSTFMLLDPAARQRQASTMDLERAITGSRPRYRGYADAAQRLGNA